MRNIKYHERAVESYEPYIPGINYKWTHRLNLDKSNEKLRKGLEGLKSIVMVRYPNDKMIIPSCSSWFAFETNDEENCAGFLDDSVYQQDSLGLRERLENKTLFLTELRGSRHSKVTTEQLVGFVKTAEEMAENA